ncbi:MAG: polysaccharide biosynthesis/export family protein [Desulfobacterales bacterium]|nr:polysaccharide biosynthesis/export family protein [Desulfobacterales bacterium]
MRCNNLRNGFGQKRGLFFTALSVLLLSACAGISPKPTEAPLAADGFQVDRPLEGQTFASPEMIRSVTPQGAYSYRVGPGDILDLTVWKRPEISAANIVVGPDGTITIPRIGIIDVRSRLLGQVREEITAKLTVLYEKPEVTLAIREFHNNKAFVLGRVVKPGVVNFPGEGTLLEALALAGGLPYHGKETFLTKCAIIRGRDIVIWIDLMDLLNNGNMSLNARIHNNDVIFIPEAEDETAFVMGEVANPGAVQLKRGLSLVKAVMLAGGLTADANPEMVFILRQSGDKGEVRQVDLKQMLEHGDFSGNYALRPNDIVFVGPTGMRKFNYAMEQLLPTLRVLNLATSIGETFGLMQEFRRQVWGQEGFVSD